MTPTDRELDRAIAELRGWKTSHTSGCRAMNSYLSPCDCGGQACPHYTTDPAWTITFLEEMRAANALAEVMPLGMEDQWVVYGFNGADVTGPFSAPTLGRAVAEAYHAMLEAKRADR